MPSRGVPIVEKNNQWIDIWLVGFSLDMNGTLYLFIMLRMSHVKNHIASMNSLTSLKC